MLEIDNCIQIYNSREDKLFVESEWQGAYSEFRKRIAREPEYNVWYDKISKRCFGPDETYSNIVSKYPANEASMLTTKEDFLLNAKHGYPPPEPYRSFLTHPQKSVTRTGDMWCENLEELKKYRDSTILIVGGGPSALQIDYDNVERDYLWTCNAFYKNKELKEREISLCYINSELDMNIPEFADVVERDDTICAIDTSISRSPSMIQTFYDEMCKCFLFNQRVSLTSGAVPKLITLATYLGAKKVIFAGWDGWTQEQIENINAGAHAFEPNKKLKISANYNFDFQRREAVLFWDYLLTYNNRMIKYQNIGENYDNNMSKEISKRFFPLEL